MKKKLKLKDLFNMPTTGHWKGDATPMPMNPNGDIDLEKAGKDGYDAWGFSLPPIYEPDVELEPERFMGDPRGAYPKGQYPKNMP